MAQQSPEYTGPPEMMIMGQGNIREAWALKFHDPEGNWVGIMVREDGEDILPVWRSSAPMTAEEKLQLMLAACGHSGRTVP